MRPPFLLAPLLVCFASASAQEGWPQFRGPLQTARADGTGFPIPFDLSRHRLWRIEVPEGHSSPVIWGERLYLSGAEGSTLILLCLDRREGKVLWRRELEGGAEGPFGHVASTRAMPTACTNGVQVFFHFGGYGLLAVDAATGATLWERKLGLAKHSFGTGSSPVLVDDLVILQRDGDPDSRVYAFAQEDGELRWSIPRLGYISSYATPYLWEHAGGRELVIAGTGSVEGRRISDGGPIWEVRGLSILICTSPIGDAEQLYFAAWSTPGAVGRELVVAGLGDEIEFTEEEIADATKIFARLDKNADGVIEKGELPPGSRALDAFAYMDRNGDGVWQREEYLPNLERSEVRGNNLALAIRRGGEGDISATHVAWSQKRGVPYVSSPLLYRDRIWLAKAGGFLSCLDARSGEAHFLQERLPAGGEYYATPVGIDDHVLVCAVSGQAFLVKAADELEIVRAYDFEEELCATPALVDGRMYLRSRHALWALGESGR